MGLDIVELVIEIEETFQIRIEDDQAARLRTVGDLYDYILTRLPNREMRTCLGAVAFYRVRRALIEELGVERRAVGPRGSTAEIVPRARRRDTWHRLNTHFRWRFPPLRRPHWLVALLTSIILVGYLSTIVGLRLMDSTWRQPLWSAPAAALAPWLLMSWLAARSTRPWARELPRGCATIGELSSCLLTLNLGAICRARDETDRDAVWSVLQSVIVEQLGVKPELVTRQARFVEDLGAD